MAQKQIQLTVPDCSGPYIQACRTVLDGLYDVEGFLHEGESLILDIGAGHGEFAGFLIAHKKDKIASLRYVGYEADVDVAATGHKNLTEAGLTAGDRFKIAAMAVVPKHWHEGTKESKIATLYVPDKQNPDKSTLLHSADKELCEGKVVPALTADLLPHCTILKISATNAEFFLVKDYFESGPEGKRPIKPIFVLVRYTSEKSRMATDRYLVDEQGYGLMGHTVLDRGQGVLKFLLRERFPHMLHQLYPVELDKAFDRMSDLSRAQ